MRELYNSLFNGNNKKLFLILTLFAVLILITGCGVTGGNNQKYYTGYNSVEMQFVDSAPPTTFYYDSTAGTTTTANLDVNTIPIAVQLYNRGSSNAYGALFIHGFDPNTIAVQGYTLGYPGYSDALVRGGNLGSLFSGYFNANGGLAAANIIIPTAYGGGQLSFSNIAGQKSLSFSSLSTDRASLFSALHFQIQQSKYTGYTGISLDVLKEPIGYVLNPITQGLFADFNWGPWLQKFDLEGRNRDNPIGGSDTIEFPATMLNMPASMEQYMQTIEVTSCFDYATHSSTMVCLAPEPNSVNRNPTCRPTTVSAGGGQGAPVAITTIEQRPAKGRTTFVINVHLNKQNSDDLLYDLFSLYKCDPSSGLIPKTSDLNIVYIGYVYLSTFDITMSCIPDQVMRLDDAGNGQITCSIAFPPGSPTSEYQANLEVELWYGYSKTIRRDVRIIRQ